MPKLALSILCSLVLACVTLSLVVVMLPATDEPRRVDVIFLVGPVVPTSMAIADRMLAEGLSDNLVLSRSGPFTSLFDVCAGHHEFAVYCATPDPFTTQGEARYLRDLAGQHDWHTAAVITSTMHTTRTRLLMERCFAGDLSMIADSTTLSVKEWVYQYVYQSAAFVKVALDWRC